jgi:hypothetical protein
MSKGWMAGNIMAKFGWHGLAPAPAHVFALG